MIDYAAQAHRTWIESNITSARIHLSNQQELVRGNRCVRPGALEEAQAELAHWEALRADNTHEEGSTMITIDTIGSIHTVYAHVPDRRSKAKPGATRVISARRNGAVKTWKTRPTAFRAPFKYGLKECFYVTDANAHQFFASEEEAAASPVQTYIG